MAQPSWTTRDQRPGEAAAAYVFTDTASFERRIDDGRLPRVDRVPRQLLRQSDPGGRATALDVVLEIEVDGAQQVKALDPEAMLIFVLPAVA